MTDAGQSGELLLASLLAFLDRRESEIVRGAIAIRLHPRALEYIALRLQILHDLESLRQSAPVEFFRGAFADVDNYTDLQKLQNILRNSKRLCVSSTMHHLRDPTRVNLLPFKSLTHLELRSCDLSTSAWLGFSNVNCKLESLTCIGCLEEIQHLLAPFSSAFGLHGGIQGKDKNQVKFWPCLTELICKQNSLSEMDNSLNLKALQRLDLSSNNINAIQNIQECLLLTELNLSHNNIESLLPFRAGPVSLACLILQGNAVKNVRGISSLTALTELDLRCNLLASYQEFNQLQDLANLRLLWLEGNPLSYAPFYRLDVLSWFPGPLLKLDGRVTRKEEREAVGLRNAGQIPLAWKMMSDYVGQQEFLWRPPKQASSRDELWRARSLRASPSLPPSSRQRRLSSRRTVPARRIVDFSGDPIAALEETLERPSSPSPFHPSKDENFETASISSTTSGVHPRTLGTWGNRHVQTIYRERSDTSINPGLPSASSSKTLSLPISKPIPHLQSFLQDVSINTPQEELEDLKTEHTSSSSSLSVSASEHGSPNYDSRKILMLEDILQSSTPKHDAKP